jgi:hypothetical protein
VQWLNFMIARRKGDDAAWKSCTMCKRGAEQQSSRDETYQQLMCIHVDCQKTHGYSGNVTAPSRRSPCLAAAKARALLPRLIASHPMASRV